MLCSGMLQLKFSMVYMSENTEIKTDEATGAQYWVARLDKLMFTWFDVPPFATFPLHSHESEQITYVPNGELFFEVDEQTHCLKVGDCIAIPSGKEHKVWTETMGARAIDAWSPINALYR